MDYKTIDEVLFIANSAEGKSFYEIDKTNRLRNIDSKGVLGNVIEESLFGYKINSKSEADFKDINLELKVTPVKENKDKSLSAKERLVLNIIDYFYEVLIPFEQSSFWNKNKKLLIMLYKWKPDIAKEDYKILKSFLFELSTKDLIVVRNDWKIIVDKIKMGKAHEISEGDTQYLGACTKGANKNSTRLQPFSNELAKQRAFCFKQSFMTTIIRQQLFKEQFISLTNETELKEKSIKEIVLDKFKPYLGRTLSEISAELNIELNFKAKHMKQLFISNVLGIKGTKLNKFEELEKANIKFKTVKLERNGNLKESMSFSSIDFNEILNEEWDESFLNEYFSSTQLLFIVFQELESGEILFRDIKLWRMPDEIIDNDLRIFWQEIRDVLLNGVKLERKNNKVYNNFPKTNFNGKFHVRPKAKDAKDVVMLPDGQFITKQGYWLNSKYVLQIIDEK